MAEKRVDPLDRKKYTFEEIKSFYGGFYTQQAIEDYWQYQCKPVSREKKHKATSKANQREAVKATELKISVVAIGAEPLEVNLSGVRHAGQLRDHVTAVWGLHNGYVRLINAEGEILDDWTPLSDGVITAVRQSNVPLTGKIWMQFQNGIGMHSEETDLGAIVARTLGPNGDFLLKATAVPRAMLSFESFAKQEFRHYPKHSHLKQAAEVMQNLGQRPADVLWSFLNAAGYQGYSNALAPKGFISLAGTPLAPEATSAHLDDNAAQELRSQAIRAQLVGLPIPQGVPAVTDLERIKEIIDKRGSIGEAFLPDALKPILEFSCFVGQDHRDATVFIFATDRYCFKVEYAVDGY